MIGRFESGSPQMSVIGLKVNYLATSPVLRYVKDRRFSLCLTGEILLKAFPEQSYYG